VHGEEARDDQAPERSRGQANGTWNRDEEEAKATRMVENLSLSSMHSSLSSGSGLNWAQKTLVTLFASTLFIYGLDRTVPAVHNFLMGAFSCHGG